MGQSRRGQNGRRERSQDRVIHSKRDRQRASAENRSIFLYCPAYGHFRKGSEAAIKGDFSGKTASDLAAKTAGKEF